MYKKELIEALKDADDYADVFFCKNDEYYMVDIAYFDSNNNNVILEEKDI